MKKVICLIAVLTLMASCKKEESNNAGSAASPHQPPRNQMPTIPLKKQRVPPADGKYPEMTFASTEHDFGAINQGDKVNCVFTFENTGEADLLIENAVGSCGCTVPDFPKENIKPGASGKIKVSFNSSGKNGQQHKTVTLTTNTEAGTEKLHIKANINPVSGSNMQPVATPNK